MYVCTIFIHGDVNAHACLLVFETDLDFSLLGMWHTGSNLGSKA